MTNFAAALGQKFLGTDLDMAFAQVNAAIGRVANTVLTADTHLLRSYGAALDGVTDDLAAFQAVIADARSRTPAIVSVPTVTFDLRGVTSIVSGPIQTGSCNVAFIGSGPNVSNLFMAAGGGGLIQHGSLAAPAVGYLHIEGLALTDHQIGGSGSTGVYANFGGAVTYPCFTMRSVTMFSFTQPTELVNAPRSVHVDGVVIFGTNAVIPANSAFKVSSTKANSAFVAGCFSYSWTDILVSGYCNGWDFSVGVPLEGQTFVACKAYNGWGLVKVRLTPDTDPNYKSLLWSFTDCDWQGLGFALDMDRCRAVIVRGGFFISNSNSGGLALPNAAARRRYFQFTRCSNVLLDNLLIAVSPGVADAQSLIYLDSNCDTVRTRDLVIEAYSTCYAGFEIDPIPAPNFVAELDTRWKAWNGGPRILDAGNNQAIQSIVRDENTPGDGRGYYGDVNSQGRWDLRFRTGALTTDADGRIAILYPTRPGGSPFFLGGPPSVQALAENSLSFVSQPSVYASNLTGCVMQFPPGTGGGIIVAFDVSVGGF